MRSRSFLIAGIIAVFLPLVTLFGLSVNDKTPTSKPHHVPVYKATATQGILNDLLGNWTNPKAYRRRKQPHRVGRVKNFNPRSRRRTRRSSRRNEISIRPRGSMRTVCVRLCDGYYWPMTFNAGRSNLRRDSRKCQSSCDAPSRMFYLNGHSDDIANMRDMKGRRYRNLSNAFVYRKKYLNSCKCKADPWTAEAKQNFRRRVAWQKKKGQRRKLAQQRRAYLKKRRARRKASRKTRRKKWRTTSRKRSRRRARVRVSRR